MKFTSSSDPSSLKNRLLRRSAVKAPCCALADRRFPAALEGFRRPVPYPYLNLPIYRIAALAGTVC